MRLIDADELMKQLAKEKDTIDKLYNRPNAGTCMANFAWHRKNEIVRVQGIVAHMPDVETK